MARIFAFLLVVFCTSSAWAQNVTRYLTIEPPASWINKIDRPEAEFPLGRDREVMYLLVDTQIRHSESDTHAFLHYAEQLTTPNAVEENSSLSIRFDPSYQVVSFHHLHRVRDGVVSDILDRSLFDMYRAEVDRDKLIYNGEMVLSYLVPDVRAGDILDYSYTIHGRNPALGSEFSARVQLQYGAPVQYQYKRVLVPDHTEIQDRSFRDPRLPAISDIGDETEYLWVQDNIPAIDVDDDLPSWYIPYPTTYLSSYDSWAAVGAHFAPFYDVSNLQSAELQQIATEIRNKHVSNKDRLRAALDFVQREIRYLGIEIGPGGFVPRQPDQVLRNRFGDCKDMVVLLIALLAELGIEASPVLVDFDRRHAIEDFPPSHSAFDHVIVSAVLAGRTYFLDPTRGVQLGDLDHLQQADFGKGLVVAENGPGLVPVEAPKPELYRDFTDTYDVVSDPDTITLTSVSRYRMGSADAMLSWYQKLGPKAANKSFLEFYQNSRPQTEAIADLQVDIDETAGELVITGQYRIPGAWKDSDTPDVNEFYADTGDLLFDMPNFVGAARTMPYALSHPTRTRQSMRFLLDDTWAIDAAEQSFEQPAFEYNRTEHFLNDVYTKEITYISKADRITASDFPASMADIRDARNDTQVSLTIDLSHDAVAANNWLDDTEDGMLAVYVYFFGVGLIALTGAVLTRNRDVEWRKDQVYHPVSVTKFIVMTIGTIGVYPTFWSFKNWQWIRDVGEQPVSPFWRAVFNPVTNFSLFARIAAWSDKTKTHHRSAMGLAAILLVGTIFSWYEPDLDSDVSDWLLLFTCATLLAWLPMVVQVKKLNSDYPVVIRKNSRFGWPAIGVLVLCAPFYAMIALIIMDPSL